MNFTETHGEIANLLGLQPTRVKVAGEPFPKGSVAGNNVWILESNIKSTDVEEHISHLLNLLTKYGELKKRVKKLDAVMSCMIEIADKDEPTVNLSPEIMQKLGGMGCSFDLDYYVNPEISLGEPNEDSNS